MNTVNATISDEKEIISLSNDLRIEIVDLQDEDEDLALAMNCSNG